MWLALLLVTAFGAGCTSARSQLVAGRAFEACELVAHQHRPPFPLFDVDKVALGEDLLERADPVLRLHVWTREELAQLLGREPTRHYGTAFLLVDLSITGAMARPRLTDPPGIVGRSGTGFWAALKPRAEEVEWVARALVDAPAAPSGRVEVHGAQLSAVANVLGVLGAASLITPFFSVMAQQDLVTPLLKMQPTREHVPPTPEELRAWLARPEIQAAHAAAIRLSARLKSTCSQEPERECTLPVLVQAHWEPGLARSLTVYVDFDVPGPKGRRCTVFALADVPLPPADSLQEQLEDATPQEGLHLAPLTRRSSQWPRWWDAFLTP